MSADFKPDMRNFKDLTPFRFWCQKVLPTCYDDSLSYYEVLCRVKDTLNSIIENMNNLHLDMKDMYTAYEQLEDYVNHYFDNLDVQQEINNKLDAMAESGTLSELIGPFVKAGLPSEVESRIDGVVAEQIGDTVATQLPSEVGEQLPNQVATQAPSMVTAWLNSHVNPKSDVVIDDTLTIQGAAADAKATGELKSAINHLPYVSEYVISNVTDGKYLDNTGTENSYTGWSITDYMPITNIGMYYMPSAVTSNVVKSCLFDENKNFVTAFKTDNEGYNKLCVPDNIKYVVFSIPTTEINNFNYWLLDFISNNKNAVHPLNIYGNLLIKSYKDELIQNQFYTTTGGTATSENWDRTQLYEVNTGDVVTIIAPYNNYAVLFDENKDFISYKIDMLGEKTISFVIESGTKYVGFNILKSYIDNYSCTVNGIPLGAIYDVSWLANRSVWDNKTYISHGDSITWQDGKAYTQGEHIGEIARGYQTIFSESVYLKSYNNQGKSGWPMAIVNGNGVVNTIMAIADYGIYDLCTIACGTNDFKLNVPLGTLGQIGDTTFDDSTFYGAYRKAVEYILASSPTIRLVLMTPLQRNNAGYDVNYINSAGCKLIDYVNAIKSIGEMYGLPVCDMYANSGFTEKTLATYTMDGLHPNDIGYTRMGDYLTGFLNVIGN